MVNLPTKIFTSHPKTFIKQPYLVETQIISWNWFIKKGIKELFKEISPIKDHSGKELELYFIDYYFDKPKYDEETARFKNLTYEAPLRAKVKLINHRTKKNKEQEIYLADFPVMTKQGTFIINGVERVVVSQLIRSSGVYFTAEVSKGRKFFGAKVIPNRGAWLEFETDSDGFIGVKIDRHRKAPVTALLRIFQDLEGRQIFNNEKEILETFNDVDTGQIKFIETTLRKDSSKDIPSAYVEVYKRLRPGDLVTPENARNLIDAMFQRSDRYDLSEVGRFKINQRLEIKDKVHRLFDTEDLILIIKEIIRLNNDPLAEPDDIDHLGNRRVRAVGELLQNRFHVGFARLRRVIQERMSTIDIETLTPVQLINARKLIGVIKEFFASSQLSQFMDQVNPLAELEHKRRLSSMGPGGLTRERAKFEVRDVHNSHYGRICPIETPEGPNIGLISYLANFSRLNNLGFLETPYAKVKKGKITSEIVWLNALDEKKYKIAQGSTKIDKQEKIKEEIVEARINGEPGICLKNEVELIDVAPHQLISIAASLIPFLGHDDAKRALMGSNMQRQAVPLINPKAPYVGTGAEERVALDSGRLTIAEFDGEVVEADAKNIKIKSGKETQRYILHKFRRSNHYTCISQKILAKKGDKVKKGDILADGPSTDNGVLALGQNLLTAFISWEGANFEDAIVLSERVVKDDIFTSIHVENFHCDVRSTKLGPEITTPDIANISEEKLKNLDEEGIIRIGAEVRANDILVGKISPKGEVELTSEERLLHSIFKEKAQDVKDTSLTMSYGKSGWVVGIKIFSRDRGDKLDPGIIKRIQIEVAGMRKIKAGDKLAGRHGNKGVISQIRPIEDMPYLKDGTPIDIILSPLGVASRMNLGQILETHLGLAGHALGYRAVSPSLSGATENDIKAELKKAGFPESGKLDLYDGRTGKLFSQPIAIGYMYVMKLNHLVEDKIHMRSIGPYSLITQQPLGGKAQSGGQRFGEMEVWALQAYGTSHILQEMLTIKSDDVVGRAATFESIIKGEEIKNPNTPSAFNVLISELKALGLNIETIEKNKKYRKPKES